MIKKIRYFFLTHSKTYKRMERDMLIGNKVNQQWEDKLKAKNQSISKGIVQGMIKLITYLKNNPSQDCDMETFTEKELMLYSYIIGINKFTEPSVVESSVVNQMSYLDISIANCETDNINNMQKEFNLWSNIYDFYLAQRNQ